jgi:hypothetical protein
VLHVSNKNQYLNALYLFSSPDSAFHPSAPIELWIESGAEGPSFSRRACWLPESNRREIIIRQTNYAYSDSDRTEFYSFTRVHWETDHYVESKIDTPSEAIKQLFTK